MRAALAMGLLSLAFAGCGPARGCRDTCEQAIADECALDGMEACEALCDGLSEESETAGCREQWLDLEYCMGLDPVCAAHSRCGAERGIYNDCVRAFCDSDPDACGP